MNSLVIPTLYFVGIVIACGLALICIIVKNSIQAEEADVPLRKGFRSLGTYLYLGFVELFRQLFSKNTLIGIFWYLGLFILLAGFAGLIYLFLS